MTDRLIGVAVDTVDITGMPETLGRGLALLSDAYSGPMPLMGTTAYRTAQPDLSTTHRRTEPPPASPEADHEGNQHQCGSHECNNIRGVGIHQHHQDAPDRENCACGDHPVGSRFLCCSPRLVRCQGRFGSQTRNRLTRELPRPRNCSQNNEGDTANYQCNACDRHPGTVGPTPPRSAHMGGWIGAAAWAVYPMSPVSVPTA